MTRDITHSISVRREGDRVMLEDKEGPGVLRITFLDHEAAIAIGREMVRLGLEARDLGRSMKTLELGPHTDPYPEDRQ